LAEVTIQQLMDALPDFFVPDRAVGVNQIVQLNLAGEKGGDWVVHIHDQQIDVNRGNVTHPDLAVSGNAQDVLDMFTGKLDPMRAYMLGRIRLAGSMSQAMKFSRYFDIDMKRLRSIGAE